MRNYKNPPKVSVIIPMHNAETTIRRCSESLFNQTLKEMEYIFIDDKSSDGTIGVLQDVLVSYPLRTSQVKIIRLNENKGVANARKEGMRLACGEYMIHCDSDDWVDVMAYEKMYRKAVECDADIVTSKKYEVTSEGLISKGITYTGKGRDALLTDNFVVSLWNKLIRTSLIQLNGIYPYEGINWGEDFNVSVRAYAKAGCVSGIDESLYFYNKLNESSLSHISIRTSCFFEQVVPNISKLESWFEEHDLREYDDFFGRIKIKSKIEASYLMSCDFNQWLAVWPESHKYVLNVKNLTNKEKLLYSWGLKYPIILKLFLYMKKK